MVIKNPKSKYYQIQNKSQIPNPKAPMNVLNFGFWICFVVFEF